MAYLRLGATMIMEQKKDIPEWASDDDVILNFCVDGVAYVLRHNNPALTQEQTYNHLKHWFPDVEILPADEQLSFDDDGA